ncbi:MAG TPA: site-2 protease family protein, partial [Burkholderiaceae bacterium]|nr:site-2 protease family protein [Burkholderiaceae bacterium]
VAQPLLSADWHRVASLRPRLRAAVRIRRQTWRGRRWYLLCDEASGRQHLVNEAAYRFIGRCDGAHDVQAVWGAVLDDDADAAPTQPEVIELLVRLDELDLLQCDRSPDADVLFRRHEKRRAQRRRSMINPLSFRLSLGNPSRWLTRLDPLAHALFRPTMFWLWLVAVLLAALAAAASWDELVAHGRALLVGPRALMLAWLCFPVIKALHELGHALAVRRWGGEVHEFGIGLMLLVPAPYVDASAASAFERRGQRAAVAAAGIAVELALAAMAALFWVVAQPGIARDIAFIVLATGGISTLAFNGNPLLRFDGYHAMCDLLELPNLATRSQAWWTAALRRLLHGRADDAPRAGHGEAKWLAAYAPLSLAYRVPLAIGIVWWMGAKAWLLGVGVALYLVISMFLWPLAHLARQLLATAADSAQATRAGLGLVLIAVVPAVPLFVLPVPLATIAPAVVWLPDRAQLRPQVDGFVAALPMADGQRVSAGDLVLVLENPSLESERAQIASRLEGLQADQLRLLWNDAAAARNVAERIVSVEAELARADERLAALQVRAQVAGTLVMPRQGDLLGSYAKRGATIGHVLAPDQLRVRAAIGQDDADLVRQRTLRAEVRLADLPQQAQPATLAQDTPAASHVLPSAALGDRSGGPYATEAGDDKGLRTLDPVFLVDLSLPGTTLARAGTRAWVRFDHGSEPLALQALRRLTQLFLRHFNPSE